MDLLVEAMESASLVAIAVLVTIPLIARAFSLKAFSYPPLIAFCAGYVAGAGAASLLGLTGLSESALRLGVAMAAMQATKFVVRKHADADSVLADEAGDRR